MLKKETKMDNGWDWVSWNGHGRNDREKGEKREREKTVVILTCYVIADRLTASSHLTEYLKFVCLAIIINYKSFLLFISTSKKKNKYIILFFIW